MTAKTTKKTTAKAKPEAKSAPAATGPAAPIQAPKLLSLIPLDLLHVADENARSEDRSDVTSLATSIAAVGLLEPLQVYEDVGRPYVWDGHRRLRALQLLWREERLPASLKDGIPAIMTTKADAARKSLATFVRDDMHPADRFMAFSRLFDQGLCAEQIAGACNVTTKEVSQLLRFRALAPEILDAFKGGEITFDAAVAFTVTEDHTRQKEVLASFKGKDVAPHYVRQRITHGAIQPHSPMAVFVGREAYLAAGGVIYADLFTQREVDECWGDRGLVERLAAEKWQTTLDELKAEGWGQVIEPKDTWSWAKDYERVDKVDVPNPLSKKGATVKGWTAEQKAASVAFAWLDHGGKPKIERGWRKQSRRVDATGAPKPKADPLLHGFGNKGHEQLTTIATVATRVQLLRKPQAAYDALLTHLAWETFGGDSYGFDGVSTLAPESRWGARPQVNVAETTLIAQAEAHWGETLPKTRIAFCEAVAALSPDEKAQLLALCFGRTLDATENGPNGHPGRWSHLGWIAKHAGLDPAHAWTPDAEFLKSASKEALVAALIDMGMAKKDAEALQDSKKGELVQLVAAEAARTGWTPKLLQLLPQVSGDAERQAEDERKAKSKAALERLQAGTSKDEVTDQDALTDEDASTFFGDDEIEDVETFADDEAEALEDA